MDKTQLFKAAVMTVKVQRKGELDKNRILSKSNSFSGAAGGGQHRDEFSKQAKDVCNKITTLRNVLIENRTAYMHIGQYLKNASHMSDEQRDVIDRESEKFVTFYTQHLAQMRSDWKRAKRKKQQQEHMMAVIELLINYLSRVQKIYLDQKKYRVQYELETYRLLKLAADKKKIPIRPVSGNESFANERDHDDEEDNDELETMASNETDFDDSWSWNEDWGDEEEIEKKNQRGRKGKKGKFSNKSASNNSNNNDSKLLSTSQTSQKVAVDEDIQKSQQLLDDEEAATAKGLSPEDIQMFEQENAQLYHELQGLSEEVELIERNVVDIAQLQDIFTEKVSMQHHNIERIANAVIGTTENVKDANEQIRQAIQRNAGLRVWSLFFLLVMSFTLLFLDWYYD